MNKEDEKMKTLNKKFTDIKGIREKIIGEASGIEKKKKKDLSQKKAVSPQVMQKNLKSISSFLENFTRMIQNLNGKVETLVGEVDKIKSNLGKIESNLRSV